MIRNIINKNSRKYLGHSIFLRHFIEKGPLLFKILLRGRIEKSLGNPVLNEVHN